MNSFLAFWMYQQISSRVVPSGLQCKVQGWKGSYFSWLQGNWRFQFWWFLIWSIFFENYRWDSGHLLQLRTWNHHCLRWLVWDRFIWRLICWRRCHFCLEGPSKSWRKCSWVAGSRQWKLHRLQRYCNLVTICTWGWRGKWRRCRTWWVPAKNGRL